MRRFLQLLAGGLLGVGLAALMVFPLRRDDAAASDPGRFLASPYPAPEFTLTSHGGARAGPTDFPGRVVVVFFGYTHCPDVCPLTLANLSRALGDLGGPSDVQLLFVSVDPERDDRARLETYVTGFDPSFIGLTGSADEVRRAADAYGVFYQSGVEGPEPEGAAAPGGEADHAGHDDPSAPPPGLLVHSGRAFVLGREGRVRATWPPNTGAAEMRRDLERLLAER